jgi:hypothetical protein
MRGSGAFVAPPPGLYARAPFRTVEGERFHGADSLGVSGVDTYRGAAPALIARRSLAVHEPDRDEDAHPVRLPGRATVRSA